jgi:hypothetical protein
MNVVRRKILDQVCELLLVLLSFIIIGVSLTINFCASTLIITRSVSMLFSKHTSSAGELQSRNSLTLKIYIYRLQFVSTLGTLNILDCSHARDVVSRAFNEFRFWILTEVVV